jgi:uncharacterized membrane protein YdjX (TVP38/TMEM64 family)
MLDQTQPRFGLRGALIHPWTRLGLLVLLLVAAAVAALVWSPQSLLSSRGFAGQFPAGWGLLVFTACYALCTVAFVPKPLLNVAAGLLFPVPEALAAAVLGTTLGAGLAFGLGRSLGREALRPLLRGKLLEAMDRQLTVRGFRCVLLMRLIPGVPFAAANYSSAVSGTRLWPFLLATALGVVPNTAAYVVAGGSVGDPSSPAFLVSTGVIVGTGLLSAAGVWRARVRARSQAVATGAVR